MTKMFKIMLCALAALTFLGCGDEKDYGNVHYDRDVCEHCQMAISDNRFSVDVRVDGKNHYFDDIGCLVDFMVTNDKLNWLKDAKIYINDASGNGEFIDARTAHFYRGFKTPMSFGWGAFKNKQEGKQDFNFDQVVAALKAGGGSHGMGMGDMGRDAHGDMGGMKDPYSAEHDMSGMEHTHGSDHGMSGDAGSTAHSQGAPHDMGQMHEGNGTAHGMPSGHAH
ncbi:MAG: hypothetical protein KH703_04550 [Campylobacter gracilis]|uniref:hypothetical protein n=1 Tax=Campylobacter gracilis TaxID=824 RepID=UPI0026ECB930|nr:hypothetical protein [Campylobacter gracilis]MBS6152669.1 hypothetical protein [Campylobacter gracilis]